MSQLRQKTEQMAPSSGRQAVVQDVAAISDLKHCQRLG